MRVLTLTPVVRLLLLPAVTLLLAQVLLALDNPAPYAMAYHTQGTARPGDTHYDKTGTEISGVMPCYIEGIKLGSINNQNTGTRGGDWYRNFTQFSTDIESGQQYTMEVTLPLNQGSDPWVWVFIDYNRDNDFDDTGELAKAHACTFNASPYTEFVTFTAGTYATPGPTRMRVRFTFQGTGAAPDAYVNLFSGECEDYTVNLVDVLRLSTASLPNPREGVAYAASATATGGAGSYIYSLVNSPAWLSINATSGQLSGTPPAGSGATTATVTVEAASGAATARRTFDVFVHKPLQALPFNEDFQQDLTRFYTVSTGSLARLSRFVPRITTVQTRYLQLDAPNGSLSAHWDDATFRSIADDPSQWWNVPQRHGVLEWSVLGTGVTRFNIAFDFQMIVNSGYGPWSSWTPVDFGASVAFEWSGDQGANWNIISSPIYGTGVGIYRQPTGGFTSDSIDVSGVQVANPLNELRFRIRWFCRNSLDDGASETGFKLDNLKITNTTPGGGGGGVQQLAVTSAATLPAATEGQPYAFTATAQGGTAPYSWSLSGAPAWLNVSATTGALSGTPPTGASGNFNFTLTVRDNSTTQQTASQPVMLTVNPASGSTGTVQIAASQNPLPSGTIGVAWGPVSFTASNGTSPYDWSIAASTPLPAGLTFNALTATLSGTPSVTFTGVITVQVTDSANPQGNGTLTMPLAILPPGGVNPLAIATTSLPVATQGLSYFAPLLATGGVTPYGWSLDSTSASLPSGLSIAASGSISGTPGNATVGTYPLVLRVEDNAGASATKAVTLTVAPSSGGLGGGTGQGGNAGLGLGGGGGGCATSGHDSNAMLMVLAAMLVLLALALRRSRA